MSISTGAATEDGTGAERYGGLEIDETKAELLNSQERGEQLRPQLSWTVWRDILNAIRADTSEGDDSDDVG